MRYIDKLNDDWKKYFKILSPEFPDWLNDYIETPQMQRLSGVSMVCGTDYSSLYKYKSFNSVLNHSIGVALIIWNFTGSKKQTLAGLFHDIAAPVFKHCIDFMNGDSEHQESTEERTEQIIKESESITKLLLRDGIRLEDVVDYHIYPIADNDTPRLSADRFEYTFSNGYFLYGAWTLEQIKHYYDNITILKNEDNINEIGFKDALVCEEYEKTILPIFANYHNDKTRAVMQFFADIVKSMNINGEICIDDLYNLSEKEVIFKILTSKDKYLSSTFKKFLNAENYYFGDQPSKDNYCVSVKGKVRYTIPLTNCRGKTYRITEISKDVSEVVNNYLSAKQSKYVGFNFKFVPYEHNKNKSKEN